MTTFAYAQSTVTGTLTSGSGSSTTTATSSSSGNSLSGTVATSSGNSLTGTVSTSSSNTLTGTVVSTSSTPSSGSSGGTTGGSSGGGNGPPVGAVGGGGGGGSDLIDICPNIDGQQPTLPAGYVLLNGQCVPGSGTGSVLGASTSTVGTPGIPNTGAGGNAEGNIVLLIISALVTLGAGVTLLRRHIA